MIARHIFGMGSRAGCSRQWHSSEIACFRQDAWGTAMNAYRRWRLRFILLAVGTTICACIAFLVALLPHISNRASNWLVAYDQRDWIVGAVDLSAPETQIFRFRYDPVKRVPEAICLEFTTDSASVHSVDVALKDRESVVWRSGSPERVEAMYGANAAVRLGSVTLDHALIPGREYTLEVTIARPVTSSPPQKGVLHCIFSVLVPCDWLGRPKLGEVIPFDDECRWRPACDGST